MILQPKLDDLIRFNESRRLQLDKNKISIREGFDFFDDSIPIHPNSSIIGLYYKDSLAGSLGFEVNQSSLHINQIQGRRGKKGYKPLTCIEWERALIRRFLKFGEASEIDNFTST